MIDSNGARKRNGDSCGDPPIKGQKRCAQHVGESPQAKEAAERRLAEQEATRNIECRQNPGHAITGKYQDIDPSKALLKRQA